MFVVSTAQRCLSRGPTPTCAPLVTKRNGAIWAMRASRWSRKWAMDQAIAQRACHLKELDTVVCIVRDDS